MVRSSISRSTEVTHRPRSGPVTHRLGSAGHRHGNLDVTALEAELVPRLEHSRAEVEAVDRLLGHGDLEVAVLGRDGVGIIPLKILRSPFFEYRASAYRFKSRSP